MGDLSLDAVWSRYQRAKQRRRCWESLWRECYTYALPQRGTGFGAEFRPGANPVERLFDGTALDGVEQLGASLLAELTPPWSQWFGLIPGRDVGPLQRGPVAEALDRVTQTIQAHFDRSNFAVEIHQCFLDLVTVGSATLLFEEAPIGGMSAFRLSAVPTNEIIFEAGPDGQIDGHFRERSLPLDLLQARFPGAELKAATAGCEAAQERTVAVVEAVLPHDGGSIARKPRNSADLTSDLAIACNRRYATPWPTASATAPEPPAVVPRSRRRTRPPASAVPKPSQPLRTPNPGRATLAMPPSSTSCCTAT